jgi:hypothetical protein
LHAGRTVQPLSYELRLPDAVQAAALRLLDASREVINATVAALLGVASLSQEMERQEQQKPSKRPTMKTKSLNSESYTGSGLALRLPPTPLRGCLERGKMFVNGWIKSVTLHSAFSQDTMLRLCG